MRLIGASLAAAALVVGAACTDEGSNAVDERRLEAVLESELLVLEPSGVVVVDPLASFLATTDANTSSTDGSPFNVASLRLEFEGEPDAAAVERVAREYVAVLESEGWMDITVFCDPTAEGSTRLQVGGARWVVDHEQVAIVRLGPSVDGWSIHVSIAAPYHTSDGERPMRDVSTVGCLDDLTI